MDVFTAAMWLQTELIRLMCFAMALSNDIKENPAAFRDIYDRKCQNFTMWMVFPGKWLLHRLYECFFVYTVMYLCSYLKLLSSCITSSVCLSIKAWPSTCGEITLSKLVTVFIKKTVFRAPCLINWLLPQYCHYKLVCYNKLIWTGLASSQD